MKSFKRRVKEILEEMFSTTLMNKLSETVSFYMSKYGRAGFRTKVMQDFDVVRDIEINHSEWLKYKNIARAFKKYIDWNPEALTDIVLEYLDARGWHLEGMERNWVSLQIARIGEWLDETVD